MSWITCLLRSKDLSPCIYIFFFKLTWLCSSVARDTHTNAYSSHTMGWNQIHVPIDIWDNRYSESKLDFSCSNSSPNKGAFKLNWMKTIRSVSRLDVKDTLQVIFSYGKVKVSIDCQSSLLSLAVFQLPLEWHLEYSFQIIKEKKIHYWRQIKANINWLVRFTPFKL